MPLQFWTTAPGAGGGDARHVPLFVADLADEQVLKDLARLVLEREQAIKRDNPPAFVAGEENIEDSLTSRYYAFNVLTWPEPAARTLAAFFKASYLGMLDEMPLLRREKVYIQCWANTVRRGESIKIHNHGAPGSYVSGNIPIQVKNHQDSFTHFILESKVEESAARFSLDNRPGKLTIFPSWLYHYTDPWPHDEVRITIAFDIVNQEVFDRQASYRVGRKYIPFDDPAGP
jgi:hypothetical protein